MKEPIECRGGCERLFCPSHMAQKYCEMRKPKSDEMEAAGDGQSVASSHNDGALEATQDVVVVVLATLFANTRACFKETNTNPPALHHSCANESKSKTSNLLQPIDTCCLHTRTHTHTHTHTETHTVTHSCNLVSTHSGPNATKE